MEMRPTEYPCRLHRQRPAIFWRRPATQRAGRGNTLLGTRLKRSRCRKGHRLRNGSWRLSLPAQCLPSQSPSNRRFFRRRGVEHRQSRSLQRRLSARPRGHVLPSWSLRVTRMTLPCPMQSSRATRAKQNCRRRRYRCPHYNSNRGCLISDPRRSKRLRNALPRSSGTLFQVQSWPLRPGLLSFSLLSRRCSGQTPRLGE